MKNIWLILKKELRRFFTDKRMLAALFFPGILIFIVYSLMGNFIGEVSTTSAIRDYDYQIVETNNFSSDPKTSKLDNYLNSTLKYLNDSYNVTYVNKDEIANYKVELLNEKYDLIIEFDDMFEENISLDNKANVSFYYNGSTDASNFIYELATSAIQPIYSTYTINIGPNGEIIDANLSTKNVAMLKVFSFIIPMVLMSLLVSTCISLAPESIAGEKERGTLGLVLITPIKRSELAIAKILSLTIVCLASGLTSFAGLILSLPKLFAGMNGSTFSFSFSEIILLLFLILSILFLIISFASFISSFAKSIKEASSYLGPFSALIIFVSIVPALVDTSPIYFSFIPLLNGAASISQIINGNIDILFLGLSILSNIVYSSFFVYLMFKMFNNENVMFNVHS